MLDASVPQCDYRSAHPCMQMIYGRRYTVGLTNQPWARNVKSIISSTYVVDVVGNTALTFITISCVAVAEVHCALSNKPKMNIVRCRYVQTSMPPTFVDTSMIWHKVTGVLFRLATAGADPPRFPYDHSRFSSHDASIREILLFSGVLHYAGKCVEAVCPLKRGRDSRNRLRLTV